MKENSARFGIQMMAHLLNVSVSGYYDWLSCDASSRAKENEKLIEEIKM